MAQAVEQLNDKQKALHPSLSTIKKKKKKKSVAHRARVPENVAVLN
jgi:hypothetical protein